MAVTVYINGIPFSFPETNDTQWGEEVTAWAQSVSAETLQPTGGSFLLTRDINFGTANGIIVHFIQTPTINATANLILSAPTKIDLNTAAVRFLSGGVYYTLQGLLANTSASFDKANVANDLAQGAYNHANGAIFTAAQIRANVSNTAPINYDPSTGIISHAVSGATASGYGDAATVPKIVVDDKGHVTSVTNTAIAISASQITSGTLAVARGGTGQTAITVNGCLLIGNTVSGGFDVNPLASGTGIDIINDKGTITIAATGTSAIDGFARDQANAAYTRANTANTTGQAAFDQANAAYTRANTANTTGTAAFLQANAAYTRANTGNTVAASAYAQANIATSNADAAFTRANTANTTGQAAFDQANAAYTRANTGNTVAASAYAQANIATSNADAAFARANAAYANSNTAIYTAAQIRSNISNTFPIGYSSATGVINLPSTANGQVLIGNTISGTFDITTIAQTAPVIVTNGKGTVTLSHASSGVTAKTYGNATLIPAVTVDAFGHVTAVTNVAFSALPAATANGQLLIGNTVSSSFDVNTITQGTGILVTNDKGSITINANANTTYAVTQGVVQATTSGTAINFTGIPSGAKRIMINFSGVSTNSSSNLVIQIGDAGGIESSAGYNVYAQCSTGGFAFSNWTGWVIMANANSADAMTGTMMLSLLDSSTFTWVLSGLIGNIGTGGGTFNMFYCVGDKSTSAELDRVRITTELGTKAFDAGKINIQYEL